MTAALKSPELAEPSAQQSLQVQRFVGRGRYIPMKQWRHEEAARRGVSPGYVAVLIHLGKLKAPRTIRKNKRIVWVYQAPNESNSATRDKKP